MPRTTLSSRSRSGRMVSSFPRGAVRRDGAWAPGADRSCPVFNIIIDFVLSLFPWLVTWKLRIERYEKVGLCIAMSLGTV